MLLKDKQSIAYILFAFASSFLLSNLIRNINSIVAPSLISVFDLSNDELGLVTSVFLASFAVAQLPLGIAIDKYGPRLCQIALLIIAIIGCMLFAIAQNYFTLIIARLLIGLGLSGGLICGLTALSNRVSSKELSYLYGIYMAFGGLGVLFSGYPTLLMYNFLGWRGLFVIMAIITALCLLMLIGLKEERLTLLNKRTGNPPIRYYDFITIIKSPQFQAFAPFIGIANGIFTACIGVWASIFMREVQDLSEVEIATILSMSALLLTIGPPLIGYIVSSKNKTISRISIENLLYIIIFPTPIFFLLAIYPVSFLPYEAQWNWLGVAFCFSANIQLYAVITKDFPTYLFGRVNTTVNVCFFMGAFIFQYGTGIVIQLFVDYSSLDLKHIFRVVMTIDVILITIVIFWMPIRLYFVKKVLND